MPNIAQVSGVQPHPLMFLLDYVSIRLPTGPAHDLVVPFRTQESLPVSCSA